MTQLQTELARIGSPFMLIALPIEGAPRVIEVASTVEDAHALASWIASKPDILQLFRDALALRGASEAGERWLTSDDG